MRRLVAALGAVLLLSACGAETILDPIEEVQRRAYSNGGPTELVLYTVINTESDRGAHSALMIAGSQRVLWDPAGSFRHPHVPERSDLLYGYTPTVEKVYIDFHARETHDVVEQRIAVPADVAERMLQMVSSHGAAASATCALSTSGMLRQLPGFSDMRQTWYPKQLMTQFDRLPGVTKRVITNDTVDANHNVLFVPPVEPADA